MTPEALTVSLQVKRLLSGYRERGYTRIWTQEGAPAVEGDTLQFYLDAVANDAGAVWLMELIRLQNRELYFEYRDRADEDGIDLDESQDTFLAVEKTRMGKETHDNQ